jgi:hypothetical protein
MKHLYFGMLLSIAAIFQAVAQAPSSFAHPGVFCSQAELDQLKASVQAQDGNPVIAGYNKLAAESIGSLSYQPTPYADVHVIASGTNAEETAFRKDAHAMYIHTIKWIVTGDNAYRDKAIQIANAWSSTLQTLVSEADHPNQATLESSWALPIWVSAAEMLKCYGNGASGWSSADVDQFKSFVNRLLTYVNGPIASAPNWYISRYLSLMTAGVFLDNATLYNQGYTGVCGQIDAITPAGSIPELTRDFVHSQYVLIGMTLCAETAYQQSDAGLFTRTDSRLRLGAEAYVQSVLGIITPNYYSDSGWARQSAPYEVLLKRYTQLGLPVPYTQNYVLTMNRVENGSEDHFVGWLTATHAIKAEAGDPNDVPGNIAYQKTVTASSEPQPENPATSAVDNNPNTRWSASGYPQWIEVDLGSVCNVNRSELICYDSRAYQYKIEIKANATDVWQQVVDRQANTVQGSFTTPLSDSFGPVQARYVRLTVTGAYNYTGVWVSVPEFRIYGSTGTAVVNVGSDKGVKVAYRAESCNLEVHATEGIRSLEIVSQTGAAIKTIGQPGSASFVLNVSDQPDGLYLCRVTDMHGTVAVRKFIIKK